MNIENVNLLNNPNFKFITDKIPGVEYFSTAVDFPSVTIPSIDIPGPSGIKHNQPGNGLDYSDLSITFLVDEDLDNYFSIYQWMYEISIPATTHSPRPYNRDNEFKPHANLILIILDNNLNPKYSITYVNAMPVNLGQISFDSAIDQPTPQKVTVSFKFDYYYKTSGDDIGK